MSDNGGVFNTKMLKELKKEDKMRIAAEEYSAKELELAFKYNSGELNDIQLNFLLFQNNISFEKIEEIITKINKTARIFNFVFFIGFFVIVLGIFYLIK